PAELPPALLWPAEFPFPSPWPYACPWPLWAEPSVPPGSREPLPPEVVEPDAVPGGWPPVAVPPEVSPDPDPEEEARPCAPRFDPTLEVGPDESVDALPR